MRHVVKLKEAALHTGLAEWELRQGAKAGRYPHMRAGGPSGTLLFDLDLLDEAITRLMLSNVAINSNCVGVIRPIGIAK